MVRIIPLVSSTYDSNIYLILDEKIALIDTGMNNGQELYLQLKEHVNFQDVNYIINTHAHMDHCGANPLFENARVFIHEMDRKELESGDLYGTGQMFGLNRVPLKFDEILKDGDIINLGEISLEVVHTPGHTPGSICLFQKEMKVLFSGDTLFTNGSFGRVDLKGGNARDLIESLGKLISLDFETLYPGHEVPVESNARSHALMAREIAGNYL